MRTWCLRKQEDNENPAFSIVIPTRNRFGPRVRNCIRGVQLQTQERIELIIADYGSSKEGLENLLKTLDHFNCTVYHHETEDVWSLSGARNLGLRRANAKYAATLDVDGIMEPDVIKNTLDIYRENPNYFITSRFCHCAKSLDTRKIRLPRDYPTLRLNCKRSRPGIGGFMSAPTKWWHKVRGFDERIKRWGADDDDMKKRAQLDGRRFFIANKKAESGLRIYHQWHPKSEARIDSSEQQAKNYRILKKDDTIIRNGKDWGYV